MGRISLILVTLLLLVACTTKQYESTTVEQFKEHANGFDHVVDRSIMRAFNTENDPDFNALIKDLDHIKILSSDGGAKGAKALFKSLDKDIANEGFEEVLSVDNKDMKGRLYELVAPDMESKWVLVFQLDDEAGLVEMNGTIDPAYLQSLSNMDFGKVKDLVGAGFDSDDDFEMNDESVEVEIDL